MTRHDGNREPQRGPAPTDRAGTLRILSRHFESRNAGNANRQQFRSQATAFLRWRWRCNPPIIESSFIQDSGSISRSSTRTSRLRHSKLHIGFRKPTSDFTIMNHRVNQPSVRDTVCLWPVFLATPDTDDGETSIYPAANTCARLSRPTPLGQTPYRAGCNSPSIVRTSRIVQQFFDVAPTLRIFIEHLLHPNPLPPDIASVRHEVSLGASLMEWAHVLTIGGTPRGSL